MKKYLVMIKNMEGAEHAALMTQPDIIRHIDMSDCTQEEIEVYDVHFGKQPEKLTVHGCWHNPKDPLYIKVVDENGLVAFDGLGTDH